MKWLIVVCRPGTWSLHFPQCSDHLSFSIENQIARVNWERTKTSNHYPSSYTQDSHNIYHTTSNELPQQCRDCVYFSSFLIDRRRCRTDLSPHLDTNCFHTAIDTNTTVGEGPERFGNCKKKRSKKPKLNTLWNRRWVGTNRIVGIILELGCSLYWVSIDGVSTTIV